MRLALVLALLAAVHDASTSLTSRSAYVEAPGPQGPLKGTMLTPIAKERPPIVLLIPGSGPTDRDGNNPLGVKAAPYALLAEALATLGVATVRIDKRGMFASAAAVADPNAVTLDDYVQDVRQWVRSIRSTTGAPCVWLLGHSEGGLVALESGDTLAGLCGVITIGTPGRPAGEVLLSQLRESPIYAAQAPLAESLIRELKAGRDVDVRQLPPVLQQVFSPSIQHFETSLFRVDPQLLAHRLRLPLLIVQGDADLQVGVEDAKRLKTADPQATLAILPGVNHVLKEATLSNRRENLSTYSSPDLPLAPGVAPVIARFTRRTIWRY